MVTSIINIPLQKKQEEHYLTACVAEKIVELPAKEFYYFKNNLLLDYDFIAENIELMYTDCVTTHCILVVNRDGEDGILVYSGKPYAENSAYVPYAKTLCRYMKYPYLDDYTERMEEAVEKYIQMAIDRNQDGIYRLLSSDLKYFLIVIRLIFIYLKALYRIVLK